MIKIDRTLKDRDERRVMRVLKERRDIGRNLW